MDQINKSTPRLKSIKISKFKKIEENNAKAKELLELFEHPVYGKIFKIKSRNSKG
jgi:hypothetical protein